MNDSPQENPFQTPKADLSQSAAFAVENGDLATKVSRLVAAIIDAIIGFIAALPILVLTGYMDMVMSGKTPSFGLLIGMALYGLLAYVLIHGYWLNKYGQTVGKRIMKIFIADLDNNEKSCVKTILVKRVLPVMIVSLIPVIGGLLVIINYLFIFRADRRCVHDLIAGTKVLKVTANSQKAL